MRTLSRIVATAILLLGSPSVLYGDHIPSAQEGLGAAWWGVVLLGVVATTLMGGAAVTVWRLARSEQEDGGPGRGP